MLNFSLNKNEVNTEREHYGIQQINHFLFQLFSLSFSISQQESLRALLVRNAKINFDVRQCRLREMNNKIG